MDYKKAEIFAERWHGSGVSFGKRKLESIKKEYEHH